MWQRWSSKGTRSAHLGGGPKNTNLRSLLSTGRLLGHASAEWPTWPQQRHGAGWGQSAMKWPISPQRWHRAPLGQSTARWPSSRQLPHRTISAGHSSAQWPFAPQRKHTSFVLLRLRGCRVTAADDSSMGGGDGACVRHSVRKFSPQRMSCCTSGSASAGT